MQFYFVICVFLLLKIFEAVRLAVFFGTEILPPEASYRLLLS